MRWVGEKLKLELLCGREPLVAETSRLIFYLALLELHTDRYNIGPVRYNDELYPISHAASRGLREPRCINPLAHCSRYSSWILYSAYACPQSTSKLPIPRRLPRFLLTHFSPQQRKPKRPTWHSSNHPIAHLPMSSAPPGLSSTASWVSLPTAHIPQGWQLPPPSKNTS